MARLRDDDAESAMVSQVRLPTPEIRLNPKHLLTIAGAGLVIGALLGMAGTFAPSASLRGLAWGIDGAALILASALLTVHHFRIGNDMVAAGFLVFAVGESLILSVASTDPVASVPTFGAGTSLWAVALALTSAPPVFPPLVRALGGFAALLFAAVSLQIFAGLQLTPLTSPLPFFAYPFLAATLFGWAWSHWRLANRSEQGS